MCLKKARWKREYPVASIPILFSIQQFIEGILWLVLEDGTMAQTVFWLTGIYAVFVGMIWPIYAPFAIYMDEREGARRKLIKYIGVIGVFLAAYTAFGLAQGPVESKILGHSIKYDHNMFAPKAILVLYLMATCTPFILSGYRNIHIAGMVTFFGFLTAYFSYREVFASVWCFFAATASIFIYFHFTKRRKKETSLL